MQAGIGGILTALGRGYAQYVIGAVVFTSRAVVPGKDQTWMRWGTMLALHGDLDDETWSQWMTGGQREDQKNSRVGDVTYPAWISLSALEHETRDRLWWEARRRLDALHTAKYVREHRHMEYAANRIGKGRIGRKILQRAQDDYTAALEDKWPDINGNMIWRCSESVLAEFRADDRCPHCGGSGITPYLLDDRRREVKCAACYGTGVTRASDRERASAIDVPWSTYKRSWRTPYEWLYQEALTARRQAVRHLREQLDD